MRLRNNPKALDKAIASNYFKDLSNAKKVKLKFLFTNNSKENNYLEIGSGKGDFLWNISLKNSDANFIGIEKSPTVILKALNKYHSKKIILNNLFLCLGDANKVNEIFEPKSFAGLFLNFSDPWPKKRHAKRRLVDSGFLKKYQEILKPNAKVEFKTDNIKLFNYCLEQINLMTNIKIIDQTTDLYALNENHYLRQDNIATEYETKFHSMNKQINKIVFKFI